MKIELIGTMKTLELKPCPFCGGEAVIEKVSSGYNCRGGFIETYKAGCITCKIYFKRESEFYMENTQPVFMKNGYEDAVKAWNTRYGEDGEHGKA